MASEASTTDVVQKAVCGGALDKAEDGRREGGIHIG